MSTKGLTERHALRIVKMSASALRYKLVPDKNEQLREAIVKLAHRHRCYGAPMINLKLRQAGWVDFVFDRVAGGRVLKILTLVDDATYESVAVEVRHWFGGNQVVELLSRLTHTRGLPKVICSDNGKEFIGNVVRCSRLPMIKVSRYAQSNPVSRTRTLTSNRSMDACVTNA